MTAIYARFNPSKVGDVPMLLAKYRGREAEMLERLEAKYARVPVFVNGVQIFPAAPAPLPATSQPSTLLQQLAQPPPPPPALAPEPIPSLVPTKPHHQIMPSSWRPGMPLPGSSSSSFAQTQGQGQGQGHGQGQGKPADPFAGLTNLRG